MQAEDGVPDAPPEPEDDDAFLAQLRTVRGAALRAGHGVCRVRAAAVRVRVVRVREQLHARAALGARPGRACRVQGGLGVRALPQRIWHKK